MEIGSMNQRAMDLLRRSVTNAYRFYQAGSFGGWAPPPLFYHLLLTYQCNVRCDFCFLHFEGRTPPRVYLPEAWISHFLERIPSHSTLSFSGGEPLCHPGLFPILERASRSHRVSMVTNGSLLEDEGCRRLVEMAPARFGKPGMTNLGISLYESLGEMDFEAVFEKKRILLERIRAEQAVARKSLPLVELKVVIRADNIHQLDRCLIFLREGLADGIAFQVETDIGYPVYYDGGGKEERPPRRASPPDDLQRRIFPDRETAARQIDRLLSSPERRNRRVRFYPETTREEWLRCITGQQMKDRYGCVFPWMGMGISPLGNAFLCRTPVSEDIVNQPVLKAWNSPNFRSFRRGVLRGNVAERCSGCCFLIRRRGG